MGRPKAGARREVAREDGLIGRRTLMEPYTGESGAATRLGTSTPARAVRRSRNSGLRSATPAWRFQYAPHRTVDVERILSSGARHVEVRVCASQVVARNDALRRKSLWGFGEYSEDSDVVAMLVHSGYMPMPRARSSPFTELAVTLRISRGNGVLKSRMANGLRSRMWPKRPGARLSVVRAVARVSDGTETVLTRAHGVPLANVPRLTPLGGTPTSGDVKAVGEIGFDLSNRPCLVYSLGVVADKGIERATWPSRRLAREVMYVETVDERYELARVENAEKKREEKKKGALYVRFARVAGACVTRELFDVGANVAPIHESDLVSPVVYRWSALKWDPTGLSVGGAHYDLVRVSFRSIITRKEVAKEEEEKEGT